MKDFNDHVKYRYENNGRVDTCRHCNHVFPPKPNGPSLWNGNQQRSKVDFDDLMAKYKDTLTEWEDLVTQHLLQHPTAECQYCHSVVKKATLKTHQKSYACSVQRRKHIMEERGYLEIQEQYKTLMQVANLLYRKMMHSASYSHETFDNEEVRDYLSEELDKAKRLFRQLAGIRLAYTSYNKQNPNLDPDDSQQGWQLRAWAPRETVAAMKEVLKKWEKLTYQEKSNDSPVKMEAYTRMWDWLLSDDEARFAAIGLWELADAPL